MPTIVKNMPIPSVAQPLGPLVVVVAYDGLCTFEFGVTYEVFGLPRPEMAAGWYRYAVAGAEPGPLRAAGGLRVTVDAGLELLDRGDLIVVPGWRHIDAPVPGSLIRALQAAHKRGARIISLCSGIAVLAAAGFLNGKRATTHWRYVPMVQSRYPNIRLEPDILYADEGDVLTAAGSAAGIDLCLHIVRGDFGPDAANSVARRLVVSPHRDGGQAQFVERPVPLGRERARLSPLLDWVRVHLNEHHSVARLAARAGMSLRTFQRRFEAATGMTPREWLIAERLRWARELLEREDDANLEDVAATVGFGSLATLRHHFRQRFGMSPSNYRARFSANGAKFA
jgi:AraC family transcriptional regulator, transcriptional activator FtrA